VKQIPANSRKVFLVWIIWLLIVFRAGVDTQAAVPTGGKTLAVVSGEFPEPESDLIAVAKLSGTADRNGEALVNGSIIASGDSLRTHADSALLLAASPEERLWLGPNTDVKLSKEGNDVKVAVAHGTVTFRSRGHVVVTVENHDGIALRCHLNSPVVAQVSLVGDEQAHVRVQQGSLELVQAGRTMLLQPGRERVPALETEPIGRTMPTSGSHQEQAEGTASTGVINGTVVDPALTVVPDAKVTLTNAAGETSTATTGVDGKFTFASLQPGTYTLHVTKSKYKPYELSGVTVRGGNASSLFIQLGGATGAGSNKTLIWVLVGGGAAAGIGAAAAASGGSSHNTSPSTLH
jgi:hypothetical protein